MAVQRLYPPKPDPDRHKLWRRVEYDVAQMKGVAPEGFEPHVLVFVVGRETPIEPTWVETRRGPDEPWVRLQVLGAAAGEAADPNSAWIHVHEQMIARIEVVYERTGDVAIGFRYTEEPAVAA